MNLPAISRSSFVPNTTWPFTTISPGPLMPQRGGSGRSAIGPAEWNWPVALPLGPAMLTLMSASAVRNR